MDAFLQHVGDSNLQHVEDTLAKKRTVGELLRQLSPAAPERAFLEAPVFEAAFPSGRFNCWACSAGAKGPFDQTKVGDVILIAPTLRTGIRYLGVVKAKCPTPAEESSKILWPQTGEIKRVYPYIFFFEAEVVSRGWFDFLSDMGYDRGYSPRGYYRRIDAKRLSYWGGARAYLDFLRKKRAATEVAGSEGPEMEDGAPRRSPTGDASADLPAREFPEGAAKEISLELLRRDHRLKAVAIKYYGGARCAVCGFRFVDFYGEQGDGFIELHHRKALSEGERRTTVKEVALVCANCHRVLHRHGAEPLDVEKLKRIVKRLHPSGFLLGGLDDV